jgi:Uma2 family endonuclease
MQTQVQGMSLTEFLEQPETKPASEYVDGRIIQKPIPQGQHSLIQRELLWLLNPILSKQGIAQAFPELRCTVSGRSVVPDVVVFREERIPRLANGRIANAFNLAPDWTIEILSPDQSSTNVLKNIRHCLDNGAQMGWLINPADESVFVASQNNQFAILDDPASALPVPTFAIDLSLTVGEIFDWLKK